MGDQKPVIHFLVGRYCAEMVGGGGDSGRNMSILKPQGEKSFCFRPPGSAILSDGGYSAKIPFRPVNI